MKPPMYLTQWLAHRDLELKYNPNLEINISPVIYLMYLIDVFVLSDSTANWFSVIKHNRINELMKLVDCAIYGKTQARHPSKTGLNISQN